MVDKIKIGNFLRQRRTEKGMTQEDLAEKFGVSSRSVSRWENGNTMPELGILVELADFYDVDIKEIIDGERESEIMEKETKETLLRVAEYSKEEKRLFFIRAVVCMLIAIAIIFAVSIAAYKSSESYRREQAAVTTVMEGITVQVTEVLDSGTCNAVVGGGNDIFSSGDIVTIHYDAIRKIGSEYADSLRIGDMIVVTYQKYCVEKSDSGYSIAVEYVDLIEAVETK